MDYWTETISLAFKDSGITATDEQIKAVAECAEVAHDNYGIGHGYYAIQNPENKEIEILKKAHKEAIKEMQRQIDCYRKSVAIRRGVKKEDVYLDEQGNVIYG